ncbi:MAG: hypothetical protein JSV80_07385, partial [Acidobacteriota bacterium]
DSVWEVRTGINDKGWSVELKIPYHAIRFSPKEEYIWGINLDRKILRKQEYDMWQLVLKNESGICSRNGHIIGIEGIEPPAHLEFLPYAAGSSFPPRCRLARISSDYLRMGSALSLDLLPISAS